MIPVEFDMNFYRLTVRLVCILRPIIMRYLVSRNLVLSDHVVMRRHLYLVYTKTVDSVLRAL